MAEQTRVLHLIKGLGRGGAEILLSEMLRTSDRNLFTYAYGYFLPWKDAMVPSIGAQGADVFCFQSRSHVGILASPRRVAVKIKEWKADLLHCHLPLTGVVGRIAGRLAKVPVVYTEHNQMEKYNPLTCWLNVRTWHWQEQAIAVSNAVAESIRRNAGDTVPIEIVLNGVDTVRFDPGSFDGIKVRRDYGIPADAPIIGTVAVFTGQKKLDDWLQAAKIVHARHPAAHFLIVGDGPLRSQLTHLAKVLELDGAVHFAGLQTDVRPYLGAMDVFLMSSRFEGFGVALIEALAMRVPVVATAVGGVPEIVRHQENGLLVALGDIEGLAAAVSTLLLDRRLMADCGQAGRRTVEERFGMKTMSAQLESLYLDVIERYRGRACPTM